MTLKNPAFEAMAVNLFKEVQELLRQFVATNLDSDIEGLQEDAERLLVVLTHALQGVSDEYDPLQRRAL